MFEAIVGDLIRWRVYGKGKVDENGRRDVEKVLPPREASVNSSLHPMADRGIASGHLSRRCVGSFSSTVNSPIERDCDDLPRDEFAAYLQLGNVANIQCCHYQSLIPI